MTLYLPDTGSGLASLYERRDTSVRAHEYGTLEVETVDLDSYIEANGIKHVDVLKIDVEGHEVSVLEGARRALKEHRIAAIMFEFGSANINSRIFFGDFWNLFDALSYDLHVVLPGGGTYQIDRYRDELEYFRGASNYIATRRLSNTSGERQRPRKWTCAGSRRGELRFFPRVIPGEGGVRRAVSHLR